MQDADLALGEGDQLDGGELQALEQGRDVLLIPRKAIERLGDDDVEGCLPGAFKHCLISWPKRGPAADRGVAIDLNESPALARDPLLAESDLVLHRRVPL